MNQQAYNLILHLRTAAAHMSMLCDFNKKWGYFVEMRYEMLSVHYPHGTFGVEQGTFEFFQLTLDYLEGRQELPKKEVGHIYKNNYADWLAQWKKQVEA